MDTTLIINTYLKKKKYNKSELARQMEISRQHFYDVLKGKQKLYVDFLVKLSKVLNLDPGYWFKDPLPDYPARPSIHANEKNEQYNLTKSGREIELEEEIALLKDLVRTKDMLIERLIKEQNHTVK